MTLDRSFFTLPTKGHFCSLLISNIFCNPLFPKFLPFASPLQRSKHNHTHFSKENNSCFLLYSFYAKGEF